MTVRSSPTDPVLTGRQLLEFADRIPATEHLVFVLRQDRQLEDIDLEESIDVREPGHDRFLTFRSDRIFYFTLDDRRQPWGAKEITETTLRELAGVGPDYRVWQERRQEEDLLLKPGPVGVPGRVWCRAVLHRKGQYDGRRSRMTGIELCLPARDQRYIRDHALNAEVVIERGHTGIVFHDFKLPDGRFDPSETDLLIVLPSPYPDAAPEHVPLLSVDQDCWPHWVAKPRQHPRHLRRSELAAMEPPQQ